MRAPLQRAEAVEQRPEPLEAIPARNLRHHGPEQEPQVRALVGGGEAPVRLEAKRRVLERRGEHRVVGLHERGVAEHAGELVRRELAILVAQRVDGGRHDGRAPCEEVADVLRRGEDRVVVGLGVRPQERPGGARDPRVLLEADVAPPHRPQPHRPLQQRASAERLRVVDDEHVVGREQRPERRGALSAHGLVQLALGRAEAWIPLAVDEVVKTLRQHEELRPARAHHRPLGGDPELAEDGDEARHHLRDPAADGGRVEHPDLPARELRHEQLRLGAQLAHPLREVDEPRVVVEAEVRLDVDEVDHVARARSFLNVPTRRFRGTFVAPRSASSPPSSAIESDGAPRERKLDAASPTPRATMRRRVPGAQCSFMIGHGARPVGATLETVDVPRGLVAREVVHHAVSAPDPAGPLHDLLRLRLQDRAAQLDHPAVRQDLDRRRVRRDLPRRERTRSHSTSSVTSRSRTLERAEANRPRERFPRSRLAFWPKVRVALPAWIAFCTTRPRLRAPPRGSKSATAAAPAARPARAKPAFAVGVRPPARNGSIACSLMCSLPLPDVVCPSAGRARAARPPSPPRFPVLALRARVLPLRPAGRWARVRLPTTRLSDARRLHGERCCGTRRKGIRWADADGRAVARLERRTEVIAMPEKKTVERVIGCRGDLRVPRGLARAAHGLVALHVPAGVDGHCRLAATGTCRLELRRLSRQPLALVLRLRRPARLRSRPRWHVDPPTAPARGCSSGKVEATRQHDRVGCFTVTVRVEPPRCTTRRLLRPLIPTRSREAGTGPSPNPVPARRGEGPGAARTLSVARAASPAGGDAPPRCCQLRPRPLALNRCYGARWLAAPGRPPQGAPDPERGFAASTDLVGPALLDAPTGAPPLLGPRVPGSPTPSRASRRDRQAGSA